jgi:hypothetical protein
VFGDGAMNWVEEMRQRLVYDEARRRRPATVEALRRCPRLAPWRTEILDLAIDGLVGDGWLREDAGGRLIVRPRRRVR